MPKPDAVSALGVQMAFVSGFTEASTKIGLSTPNCSVASLPTSCTPVAVLTTGLRVCVPAAIVIALIFMPAPNTCTALAATALGAE